MDDSVNIVLLEQLAPASSLWLQNSTFSKLPHWLRRTSFPRQFKPSNTIGVCRFATCGTFTRAFGSEYKRHSHVH